MMIDAMLPELAHAVLAATVLLGVTHLLVVTVLRRSSSALRHLVWALALGGALVAPLLGLVLPWRWEVEALPPALAATEPADPATAGSVDQRPADGEAAASRGRPDLRHPAPAPLPPPSAVVTRWLPTALGAVWLGGAAAILLRLLWGFRTLAHIRRGARPFSDPTWERVAAEAAAKVGVTPVPLLESDETETPLAIGLGSPCILLPRSAREWTVDRARAVLLHELAHLRRRDLGTHLLARTVCAAYWFHPLVWHAARRLRIESERACDDLALGAGAVPSRYVADLLEIAQGSLGRATHDPALAMARPSEFEGRLLAILEPARARLPVRPATVVAAVAVAAAAAAALAAVAVMPAQASLASSRSGPAPQPSAIQTDAPASMTTDAWASGTTDAPASGTRESPDVAANLIALLRDPEPRVRGAAASALGERRVAAAGPELARALRDPSPRVRERAAYAIGELEVATPIAISELARLLAHDPERDVRVAAVRALGESGSAAAVEALAAAIDAHRGESFRERIADALGETGQPAALPVLEGLLDERDGSLREAALEAVAEIGSPAAEAVLVRAMQSPDARLRSMAAAALGGRR